MKSSYCFVERSWTFWLVGDELCNKNAHILYIILIKLTALLIILRVRGLTEFWPRQSSPRSSLLRIDTVFQSFRIANVHEGVKDPLRVCSGWKPSVWGIERMRGGERRERWLYCARATTTASFENSSCRHKDRVCFSFQTFTRDNVNFKTVLNYISIYWCQKFSGVQLYKFSTSPVDSNKFVKDSIRI